MLSRIHSTVALVRSTLLPREVLVIALLAYVALL